MKAASPMKVRGAMLLAVLALAATAVGPAQARQGTAARSGIPPFCVMTGGPRGPGSVPQICRFFDYQQCLEAAAQLRGNCVINIDYPGKVSAPGAPWWQPPR